jgi:alkylation response protein AidB-like acyl-CoA dehydrogenase
MDLGLSEDQEILTKSAREFLERECPVSLVRELQEPGSSGHSDRLWSQLAGLGWLSLGLPSAYGGGGASLFDLGLLYEQAGRVLVPTTFYSTIHAALLIGELGSSEQKRSLLSRIAAGESVATVAVSEPASIEDLATIETRAADEGGVWTLNGAKVCVTNAHLADPMIVVARTSGRGPDWGLTAFLVPAGTGGVEIVDEVVFGRDRQSLVRLDGARLDPGSVLGGADGVDRAAEGVRAASRKATALQCMEMVGGISKVLEMTVAYVDKRQQFGVPIGSFQAVQHHIANMYIAMDGARLTSYQALWMIDNGMPAHRELAIAKAWTGETYKSVTVMSHQLWGGMGIVKESDLYLYSDRAKATELSFGTREDHLEALANQMGI